MNYTVFEFKNEVNQILKEQAEYFEKKLGQKAWSTIDEAAFLAGKATALHKAIRNIEDHFQKLNRGDDHDLDDLEGD